MAIPYWEAVDTSTALQILAVIWAVYYVAAAVYNIFLHPLANIPGPIYCRFSKLPWDYWQWTGRLPQKTAKVHAKYREIVRIGPDELSFTNNAAWTDIFAKVPGQAQWPRHLKRGPQGKNGPQSIMNTAGTYHARFRRLLSHAFSEKGLQEQQDLITKYIDLFIHKVDGFVMVAFDVISDLGWSEPFNCVENGEVHEWMKTFAETAFDTQLKFLFHEHRLMFLAPYFVPMKLQLARLQNFKYWFCPSRNGIPVHLDGARLWEAVAAGFGSLQEYCECFDSVSLCFSNGLGAPIGSVIVGPGRVREQARRIRKGVGGGLRQAGVVCAAAAVAVQETFLAGKLQASHVRARQIGRFWESHGGRLQYPVETNMVWLDLAAVGMAVEDFIHRGEQVGLRFMNARLVVHYQIDCQEVERLKGLMLEILGPQQSRL
ncbi:hypothetical protein FE257_007980 [Aspergillus nanangensis]|uniref:Aromatic amino acid beta-eliminating lyase/threonine aldolase domain-containing protein n=1 Tax=Aspergillus nanangensis TaxID=2582783 RepID=A0AAD4GV14_ASPNN|nr:hypothetical protein FE257_007980 [Aspergillus nanangensis]